MRKIETKMKQLSYNPFFGLMKCKPPPTRKKTEKLSLYSETICKPKCKLTINLRQYC